MNWMLGPLREGIMTVLIVAGPIIIAASVLGIVIGILQTATQIQDQTLPSAIKLIAVLLLLIFLGMWMFTYVTNFTEKTIGRAFSMVLSNRQSVLPRSGSPQANIANARQQQLPFMPLPSLQTNPNSSASNGFAPPPPTFTSYSTPPSYEDFSSLNSNNSSSMPPANNYNTYPSQTPSPEPNYPPPPPAKAKPKAITNTSPQIYTNKVSLDSPEPLPIIKPKLPNSSGNTETSSLSLGGNNSSSEGDELPRPKTNSGEWW